jgi:hypothetical protein
MLLEMSFARMIPVRAPDMSPIPDARRIQQQVDRRNSSRTQTFMSLLSHSILMMIVCEDCWKTSDLRSVLKHFLVQYFQWVYFLITGTNASRTRSGVGG